MREITAIGIDLAKRSLRVHAVNQAGKKVFNREIKRSQVIQFFTAIPPCLVGMEACGSAHFWARELKALGHDVRLISPQFVKPFVKTNKNDAADAEAICEALQRPSMRFVTIKSIEQQDLQCLHRSRSRLIHVRISLSNAIHGLCLEFGMILPKLPSLFISELRMQLSAEGEQLPGLAKQAVTALLEQYLSTQKAIDELSDQIKQVANGSEECKRLQTIPGVGPIIATALVASLGNGSQFRNGRHLSAWLGLVPKQHSTGGRECLLGISKRGDAYLRALLIHGARSVVSRVDPENPSRLNQWLLKKKETRGMNRAAVALANKNARAIWVVLNRKETYRHEYLTQVA